MFKLTKTPIFLFLVLVACLFSQSVFAKSVDLEKVNIRVQISNLVPKVAFEFTGADTYLSCKTKFSVGGGESTAEENAVKPLTKISSDSILPVGGTVFVDVNVLKEEKLTAPERARNLGKECELTMGMSLNAYDSSKKLLGNIKQLYGIGININQGFPLKTTKGTRIRDLKIDKDFQLNLKLVSVYAGTQYSKALNRQVPYCEIQLRNDKNAVVGLTYLDLPSEYCVTR